MCSRAQGSTLPVLPMAEWRCPGRTLAGMMSDDSTIPPRPLPSSRLLLAVLAGALLAGFWLGLVARGPNVLGIDLDMTLAVQRWQGAMPQALSDIGNLLGSTGWAAAVIGIGLLGAALLRWRAEMLFLAVLLGLRLLATQLKPVFSSPRPADDLVPIIGEWHGSGYPSGHALTASTMALGIAVIAWRRIPSRTWAVATIEGVGVLALVVGWARIWTGAHWTTDVLGGYAFGTAIAALATLTLTREAQNDKIDMDLA
jgi:membrane-associated phospholipid phosphatase